jgi:hypothetical protein
VDLPETSMIKAIISFIKRKFVYDEMEDVRAFYEKFKQPVGQRPSAMFCTVDRGYERVRFMQEELDEFKVGLQRHNAALMADALIDLVYVAKGTAIEMGLPWEELWMDVQRANMAKVVGRTHRNIGIDVAKPPGWVGPKTDEILNAHCKDQ